MALFQRAVKGAVDQSIANFDYLAPDQIYVDTACQTLRPQQVIDALNTYYHEYNACGGRVKYEWGRRVDDEIETTRKKVLDFVGKSSKDYVCAFTLNTTYGLNLILSQLPKGEFKQIVTSEIEHNSVFLPTITAAERLEIARKVLPRQLDGTLDYSKVDLGASVVVINTTSNIDGRTLKNAAALAKDVHAGGGILILDAAQNMAHDQKMLAGIDFDALCFSGHKMYGPSIGGIVIKKSLLARLSHTFIGGGTVEDVQADSFTLTRDDPASHLEAGLQDFAGIIGLGAALDWLKKYKPEGKPAAVYQEALASTLYEGVTALPGVTVLNDGPTPIVSFYSDKIDAHRLAVYLSAQGIMARSGYFCCHYHLHVQKQYPPLLRLSLGLNNTQEQVDKVIKTLNIIMEKA